MTYAMTLGYIALLRFVRSRRDQPDCPASRGSGRGNGHCVLHRRVDSPFSFLYLVTIITASMLLYRRGGMLAASGGRSALWRHGRPDVLPSPAHAYCQSWFVPTPWTRSQLYMNMGTNWPGFTPRPCSRRIISEKLQETFDELDTNRQNLAELAGFEPERHRVDSFRPDHARSPEGVITFVNPAGCQILKMAPPSIIGRASRRYRSVLEG